MVVNKKGGAESPNAQTISETSSITSPDAVQGDYGSQGGHIFEDEKKAAYWRNIYENAKYESRHRFDPTYKWTAKEELNLRWKIDKRIMFWAWLMFVSLDLNRRNINRAITDDMLLELGMNTNDFNHGQTIFLTSFLAAELPSGLISKKIGPDRWIPFIICAWSIVGAVQAGITNKAGYYACRCLLGLFMGGFIPDVVLYLTYFYKGKELPIRLSWFWTALSTCNIAGSLIAAGVLKMRGLGGLSGWQYLFIIEGTITFVIGVLSWGFMPAGPCQTASWFRGKNGWFTEHEEYILVNRLLRDDPSKGDMHNRQAVGPVRLFKSLKDFDLWPIYLLGLIVYIPPAPINNYLSLQLKMLGFSTFQANLLAIPGQFLFAVQLLWLSWFSEKVNERSLVSSLSNIWMLPPFIALVTLKDGTNPWVRYALLTLILGYPYCHAVLVGWCSRNSNTVRTRAVSAALYNMLVQSGNIVSSNIYREDDKPLYKRGNRILLGIVVANIAAFGLVKLYYLWRNKRREGKWSRLSPQERIDYIETTTDEGAKRLDFRFAH